MIPDLLSQISASADGGLLSSIVDWLESIKFLGIKMVNLGDFAELLFRFTLNSVIMLMIVYMVYGRHNRERNFIFSYIAIGAVVFLLCFLLNNVKLQLGFALGLFAIFGIIRYRTDTIPFKQMTYLFVIIGISVMNALANKKVSYIELLFTNLAITFGLLILERYLSRKHEGRMRVVYENISNINLTRYDLLMEDLKLRTGFEIKHFEIEEIDYLKDAATVIIYFNSSDNSFEREDKELG